ncbi:MAG: hypothetical protein LBI10_10580 [Deltaproteobacteria bacterium]|jgi:hypothetical protein|nr:hypothetical protein [Deltaproteobacteria bacterium]
MFGKIVSLALALALVGLLVGCEVGDRRLPPNYRVTKTPDPTVYEDDDDYGSPRPRRDDGSVRYPVPAGPDDDDYDRPRSRGNSNRNSDYDRDRSSRRSSPDRDRSARRSDRDRDRDRNSRSASRDDERASVSIVFGQTSPRELARNSNLNVRGEGSSRRGNEIVRVSAKNGRSLNFRITDNNRKRRTIKANALSFWVEDGRLDGLVD